MKHFGHPWYTPLNKRRERIEEYKKGEITKHRQRTGERVSQETGGAPERLLETVKVPPPQSQSELRFILTKRAKKKNGAKIWRENSQMRFGRLKKKEI